MGIQGARAQAQVVAAELGLGQARLWARAWAPAARGRWALYAVYLCESWVIAGIYWRLTAQLDAATIQRMFVGTAESPFAYRALMPWTMRLVSHLSGVSDPVLVDISLRVLAMFGTMVVTRQWLRHFVSPVLADVGPIMLGAILPGTFQWYWPYDFAALLLWTAGLVALVERRYAIYLGLFAIGTLNRETTGLLIGVFAATQWEALGPRRILQWTGLQTALFAALLLALRIVIRAPGGEPVEIHWLENVCFLLGLNQIGLFENWMSMLAALGFLWLLAPWHWSTKSLFLRRTCWVLPVHAIAILVLGRLAEPRVWNEWVPIVMALGGQNLMEFAREDRAGAAPAAGLPPRP